MLAIKTARKFIESHPEDRNARVLADLVLALESEAPFSLADLYTLDREHFEVAIEILDEWRIDRYYVGKARLLDVSWQHRQLRDPAAS